MKIKYKLGIKWIPAERVFTGVLTLRLPAQAGGWRLDSSLQSPEEILGGPLGPYWGSRAGEGDWREATEEVGRYPTSAAARGALRARLEGVVSLLRSVTDQNLLSSGQEWEEEGEQEI